MAKKFIIMNCLIRELYQIPIFVKDKQLFQNTVMHFSKNINKIAVDKLRQNAVKCQIKSSIW